MQHAKTLLKLLLFSITFLLSSSLYGWDGYSCKGSLEDTLYSSDTSHSANYTLRSNHKNIYLKFDIAETGQVTIDAKTTNTKKYYFSVSKVDCSDTDIYGRVEAKIHDGDSLTNIPVTEGETLYIRIDAEGYNFAFREKKKVHLTVKWSDPKAICPGISIEHLDGATKNETKDYDDGFKLARYESKHYFHFTPAVDGIFRVDIDADASNYDLVVYDRDIGCPGTELEAVREDSIEDKSVASIDVYANQEIVIMLENTSNMSNTITYNGKFIFKLNEPPVANAGPDQTVTTKDKINLDGNTSTDVDGDYSRLSME